MIRKAIESLVFSNFFTAATLALLTFSSYSIVPSLQLRVYPVLSIFFGSWMLYNFHRIYKVDMIDEAYLANRHTWLLSHHRFTKWVMGMSAFILMFLLPFFDTDDIVWLVPAGIVSVGYTIPFIPVKNVWWRLRDVPFLKPAIICAVVTYLTLAFPVFEQSDISTIRTQVILYRMIERFTFLMAVTLPFEARDMQGDKAAGLVTVANRYGNSVVIKLSSAFLLLWIALMIWRAIYFDLGFTPMLFPFVVVLLPAIGLGLIRKPSGELIYTVAFEGAIVIYSLVFIWLDV